MAGELLGSGRKGYKAWWEERVKSPYLTCTSLTLMALGLPVHYSICLPGALGQAREGDS